MLGVTLLGCGGTMPLPGRALSSCAVTANGVNLLFDCGEGTQAACRARHVSLYRIDFICLTHYHGDHIFGLPGLLQSMANLGRTAPVTVFGPEGLAQVMELVLALCRGLPFALRLQEIGTRGKGNCQPKDAAAGPFPTAGGAEKDKSSLSFARPEQMRPETAAPDCAESSRPSARPEALFCCELPGTGGLRLSAFAAQHRAPCLGYRVELPRAGRFDAAAARALGVAQADWKRLQRGETVPAAGGSMVRPGQVLGPARQGISVVFCTDTRPCPALEAAAQNADLLICDATYADDAQQGKAVQFGHSTFTESAALAARAGAKRLWLSHYSAALAAPEAFLPAAQAIFPAAEAGFDGKTLELSFEQR